jgi:molybdenum cofactor synthesis domain-containing protein
MSKVTACIILIGNEILSGKTLDKNLSWLSQNLNEVGVSVVRAHIIPDIESEIVACVNEARAKYDYVFTTGGIGPTHDDITAAAICKAFDVKLVRHPEAEAILVAYYPPDKLNDARLKMADIPLEAELIHNPVSAAPAFRLQNVFVLAGVPSIMQAMFLQVKDMLKGGAPTLAVEIETMHPEGDIAAILTKMQADYPDIEIGCYPKIKDGKTCSLVILRCDDAGLMTQAEAEIKQAITLL